MRLRPTLLLFAGVSMASVALVMSSIIFLHLIDAEHAQTALNLNTAVRKISLIRGFLPELAGASQQRAASQWQTQFSELTPVLLAITPFNRPAQALKANILDEHEAVGALFAHLSATNPNTDPRANRDIIRDQLDVRTASMVSDVMEMNDMAIAYINEHNQRAHAVMALAVSVLAGVIVALLYIFYGRIVRPIMQLEHASALFSAGIFYQSIAVSGSDEITALARSFDSMRIALRDRLVDLEAARSLIKEENDKLAQRVEERTIELKAANLELDSFAYAVSHDLRAPLRAMSGFSRALIEDYGAQLDGEAHTYLDQIHRASLHMGALIDGLLILSRSARITLQRDVIDVSEMAVRIVSELAQAEPERKVVCRIEPGLAVRGDARLIDTLLRNLLGNAWKYTLYTPQALIRLYAADEANFLCVEDNGAGFDMAHAGKLFQPFQRLHRQDEFPGTGIGLATVYRIVQRHGGVIKAQGMPGHGANFCFSLPSVATQLKDAV